MTWIDKMFKRRFSETKLSLDEIFACIEAKRPAKVRYSTLAPVRAFNKALRQYKEVAKKAYPERKRL